MSECPIILFPLFRWSGTTPEQFRDHYADVHSHIGRRLGTTWYETFHNKNAGPDWPSFAPPEPDAFTIMQFPSDEVLANIRETPVWRDEVLPDCIGFVSYASVFQVERYTWIPEPRGEGSESQHGPIVVFPVYRWSGTTPEEFMDHYINVHSEIGKRIPGVTWYESFVVKDLFTDWPVFGAPAPDAFALMMFESDEAMADVQNTPVWDEAAEDDIGFLSHVHVVQTDRVTWIPDPEPARTPLHRQS